MNNEFIKLKNYKKFFLIKEEEYDTMRDLSGGWGDSPPRLPGKKTPTSEQFYYWNVSPDKTELARQMGLKNLNNTNKWGYTYNIWRKLKPNPSVDDMIEFNDKADNIFGSKSDSMWVEPTDLK